MSTFRIEAVPGDGRCTLVLRGEADLAVADDIVGLGTASLSEPGTQELVLHLGEVTFLDSTALTAMITLQNLADTSNKRLVLAHPSANIRRILEITGLGDAFEIAP